MKVALNTIKQTIWGQKINIVCNGENGRKHQVVENQKLTRVLDQINLLDQMRYTGLMWSSNLMWSSGQKVHVKYCHHFVFSVCCCCHSDPHELAFNVAVYFLQTTGSGGVIVSVLTSSAIDRGFEPWSEDYKIGIWCFSVKHAASRSKIKD